MGEDYRSWLPRVHFDWQSHNQNPFTAQLDKGKENMVTARMNHAINMVPTNENFPVSAGTELPINQPMGQTNEPHGWFYCLPHFQQAFNPVTLSTVRDKVPAIPYENCLEAVPTNVGPSCAGKIFLVFDQSADQTTLMYGSDSRNPIQFPTWIKQLPGIPFPYNMDGAISGSKSDINHPLGQVFTEQLDENHDSDEVNEMHEDTEELNALLYSDDESGCNKDDEVTSTGHSPSSIADHCKSDWLEGSTEDVASCNMPIKKRKVCDDNDDAQSVEDTASSSNTKRRAIQYEDDVESATNPWPVEVYSSSMSERMRKEKVKETIDILQRITPSGKGKDAIVVLDEAIQYLKSLKLKAKALGLGTL